MQTELCNYIDLMGGMNTGPGISTWLQVKISVDSDDDEIIYIYQTAKHREKNHLSLLVCFLDCGRQKASCCNMQ